MLAGSLSSTVCALIWNQNETGQDKSRAITRGDVYPPSAFYQTRAVTKCALLPPPVLRQKLIFCTQTDTPTDRLIPV